MAEFIKDLKIKNGVANKVLSVDNNGNIISTDKTVTKKTAKKNAKKKEANQVAAKKERQRRNRERYAK